MTGKENSLILLVDDDPSARRAISEMLLDAGYRVRDAGDAHAAFEILRGSPEPFDLLVTDLLLPHIQGLDLAGEAQTLQPGLKVLYITGNDSSVMAASLQASRALLVKPFGQRRLVEVVEQLLHRS